MYNRNRLFRPDAKINESFTKASTRDRAYLYTSAEFYRFSLGNLALDSTQILQHRVSNPNQTEPVLVCDIGAGDFSFGKVNDEKYQGKVVTYGISATDLRESKESKSPSSHYIKGNAEYLTSLVGENKFDFIFSGVTFVHFVDPLGSLIEAYKALKPGGTLFIDELPTQGCGDQTNRLLNYLEKQ
jgi:ubiquinone/menaquinone biosynthesis C-methylase UbiE